MAKTLSYRLTQGQVGVRPAAGGILLDGPEFSLGNLAASGQSIPVAAFPVEVIVWVAPDLIPADAIVSTLFDSEPNAQPAPVYTVQKIRTSFNAAFTAAAASFLVKLRRRNSDGTGAVDVATIVDATVTSLVAFAVIDKTGAALSNAALAPGQQLTVTVTIQGAGAACPAFGGFIDIQG